jgi:hypothetical protein
MEMTLAFRRTTQRRDVEVLIRVLDLDEYCGGSGYAKEYILASAEGGRGEWVTAATFAGDSVALFAQENEP